MIESAVVHSLVVAGGGLLLGLIIALPCAYVGAFMTFRGKLIVETIFLLPLVLPPTIIGYGLLQLFGRNGILGELLELFELQLVFTLSGAVLAVMVVSFPLLYQGLKAAFLSVPSKLIEAAETLSANRLECLFYIIIPNSWHSILATILLSFCRGLGEFGATLMMAGYIEGKTDTMASAIYFAVLQGNEQKALTLGLINLAIGVVFLFIIQFLRKGGRHDLIN
ncbi:molybdate ABC transporter permease subunit [Enterococcus casseliflavus]|uniref:molybdate ABC transporter permease subunit n=1 Tax=Enterococcus casseliflavus TaxID=37734 RepID=UPI00191B1693|nr:molybdate ABC transporter permease subunit [Enterococcus casseliflavus]QQU15591.1 molybdate ABC transporter permease subunit [Enterococcus casseliflavus]